MREYGYKEFEGTGVWRYGFEAGGFQPDTVPKALRANSQQSCWHLKFVNSAALSAQLARIIPRNAMLRAASYRVRVEGYVSEIGRFGHMGLCQREIYAVSMVADGA